MANFARRMAPVAVAVALLVAMGPPVLYGWMGWQRQGEEGRVYAEHLALSMANPAARQPRLWRYNVHKVVEAVAVHRALRDLGQVRVTDCRGQQLFTGQELGMGSGIANGPTRWAPVMVAGQVAAWVQVTMDHSRVETRTGRLALLFGLVGLLLGVLLYVLPTRVVRRQAKALNVAEQQLVSANADLQARVTEAVAEVRDLSERMISTQETERRRIATDLHDGIGQLVTGLRLELELAGPQPTPQAETHRAAALELCDTIVHEIRAVVRDLRPMELESASLTEALSNHAERFETRTGIAVSFRHSGPEVTAESYAVCLLRVAQEALHNVSRHAEATEVGLNLIVTTEGVTLDIEDDGRGFDPLASTDGTGLKGMRERLAFLAGRLEVEAADGGGTHLRAWLPPMSKAG